MKIELNEKNILMHELIGLGVKVKSSDSSKHEMKGRIIDESKKTFTIETINGEKKIAKREASFEFKVKGKKVVVSGRILEFSPEDRIKALVKKFNG